MCVCGTSLSEWAGAVCIGMYIRKGSSYGRGRENTTGAVDRVLERDGVPYARYRAPQNQNAPPRIFVGMVYGTSTPMIEASHQKAQTSLSL